MAVDELHDLLRRGAVVHVRYPDEGGDSLRVAHALECDEHGVVLRLDAGAPTDVIPAGAEVEVTCPDDDRAHLGTATVIDSDEDTIRLSGGGDLRPVQRRAAQRVPVGFTMHCRRLGRGGFDEPVAAVDLSVTGAGILAGPGLVVGDVVLLTLGADPDDISCKGLVVGTGPSLRYPKQRHAHIAFATLSGTTLDRLTAIVALHAGTPGATAESDMESSETDT